MSVSAFKIHLWQLLREPNSNRILGMCLEMSKLRTVVFVGVKTVLTALHG